MNIARHPDATDSVYVHGYAPEELDRLVGSANTLESLLHDHTSYPPGAVILEAGCGVGAQTRILRNRHPGITLVSVDIARTALLRAKTGLDEPGNFAQATLYDLPFARHTFDHVFVCYVLEHLANPSDALTQLKTVLKPGGALTVIEGDHGSAFFHPETPEACAAWRCLQQLQEQGGGDGHIGRRLYSLLRSTGASEIDVRPIPVYCDPSRPKMMEGFANKTIVGMLNGIEQDVLARRLVSPTVWHKGIQDLLSLAQSDTGTFMYTFFKARAVYEE